MLLFQNPPHQMSYIVGRSMTSTENSPDLFQDSFVPFPINTTPHLQFPINPVFYPTAPSVSFPQQKDSSFNLPHLNTESSICDLDTSLLDSSTAFDDIGAATSNIGADLYDLFTSIPTSALAFSSEGLKSSLDVTSSFLGDLSTTSSLQHHSNLHHMPSDNINTTTDMDVGNVSEQDSKFPSFGCINPFNMIQYDSFKSSEFKPASSESGMYPLSVFTDTIKPIPDNLTYSPGARRSYPTDELKQSVHQASFFSEQPGLVRLVGQRPPSRRAPLLRQQSSTSSTSSPGEFYGGSTSERKPNLFRFQSFDYSTCESPCRSSSSSRLDCSASSPAASSPASTHGFPDQKSKQLSPSILDYSEVQSPLDQDLQDSVSPLSYKPLQQRRSSATQRRGGLSRQGSMEAPSLSPPICSSQYRFPIGNQLHRAMGALSDFKTLSSGMGMKSLFMRTESSPAFSSQALADLRSIGSADISKPAKISSTTPSSARSSISGESSQSCGSTSFLASRGVATGKQENTQNTKETQQCAVCGDSAICQHYGVRTCEGCKGFFKRTVQKGAKYVCLADHNCVVDKRRRNRCQFCRFQKCLAVGMVREVVRTDSLKGRRGRLPSKPKSPQECPASPPVSLITALVRAQLDTSPDTPDLDYSQHKPNTTDDFMSSNVDLESERKLMLDACRAAISVIKTWTEKIPGFTHLCTEDQQLLFEEASMDLLVLRLASRITEDSDDLIFCTGQVYHRDQFTASMSAWMNSLWDLSASLSRGLTLDVSAQACMAALTLITHREGLKEPHKVEDLQSKLICALRDHCTYNAEAQKQPKLFCKVLSKIPELRNVSHTAAMSLEEKNETRNSASALPYIENMIIDDNSI